MADPICDRCGKPVDVERDGRYTLADEWDDNDVLVKTRHIECTAEHRMKDFKKELDDVVHRAEGLLNELRSKLK